MMSALRVLRLCGFAPLRETVFFFSSSKLNHCSNFYALLFFPTQATAPGWCHRMVLS